MSSNANRQWGGRFAEGPSAIMEAINASIGFDRKMWRQDIRGSLAHAAMLKHVGIISADDEEAIRRLVAPLDMNATVPMDMRAFKFDIVLRGRNSTFFENRPEGN